MSIFASVFKEFLFAFTISKDVKELSNILAIPFNFSEIMQALILVEHLSTTGF